MLSRKMVSNILYDIFLFLRGVYSRGEHGGVPFLSLYGDRAFQPVGQNFRQAGRICGEPFRAEQGWELPRYTLAVSAVTGGAFGAVEDSPGLLFVGCCQKAELLLAQPVRQLIYSSGTEGGVCLYERLAQCGAYRAPRAVVSQ